MFLRWVMAKILLGNVLICRMFRPELSELQIMMAQGRSGMVCKTDSGLPFCIAFEGNTTCAQNMSAMDKKSLLCEAGLDFIYTIAHLIGFHKQYKTKAKFQFRRTCQTGPEPS